MYPQPRRAKIQINKLINQLNLFVINIMLIHTLLKNIQYSLKNKKFRTIKVRARHKYK